MAAVAAVASGTCELKGAATGENHGDLSSRRDLNSYMMDNIWLIIWLIKLIIWLIIWLI